VYSARALRNVDGDCLRRHFQPVGREFRLNDEVKRRVRFEYGNLTRTPMTPSSPGYDLVFCKNVAIYFRPERTRRLVRGLYEAVNDGGYLLLGHSESLWQMAGGFALVEHEGAFCYRKMDSTSETAESKRLKSPPRPRPGRRKAKLPRPSLTRTTARQVPPETADGQYERCLTFFRAEAWTQAEASLHALITSSPHFVPAPLLLGGVYVHRGRYDEACEQARCVLRLNDLEPRGHLLLGMIAAWGGRQDEARESLRRALYLNDSLALAHFWLGNLYRDRGEIDRACHEYHNVVRDWERHTLDFTEEFASDLNAEQIVDFCRRSLQRLRPSG
jgi:chemotaxis protein methyltransferase CheR